MNNTATENPPATKQPKKTGAPKGNTNNLRHGLKSARPGVGISEHQQNQINKFRLALESTVSRARKKPGTIGTLAAALIHSAVEATRVAAANRELLHKLTKGGVDVKPELRLQIDAAYLAALDRRDRKLMELGLSIDDLPDAAAGSKHDDAFEVPDEPDPNAPIKPPAFPSPSLPQADAQPAQPEPPANEQQPTDQPDDGSSGPPAGGSGVPGSHSAGP